MTMRASPLDADVFDALQDAMGEEFAEDLVNTFLDEAPVMIADLKVAAERGDADTFRRAAHSLKSNAKLFGATDLEDLARQAELGGLGAGASAQIAAVEDSYARTAAALIEWRNG
jgi:HPt (histidine-containing phosphotransfer) domain-containing protein